MPYLQGTEHGSREMLEGSNGPISSFMEHIEEDEPDGTYRFYHMPFIDGPMAENWSASIYFYFTFPVYFLYMYNAGIYKTESVTLTDSYRDQ